MSPKYELSAREEISIGFLATPPTPHGILRPDDNVPIDDTWLHSEGYLVNPTDHAIVLLAGDDTQWGAVLVRTDEGWLFESPWPKYESVILVPQPQTRGNLRWVIAILKACYRNRGALDIFDALHIGFTTHRDSSPCI